MHVHLHCSIDELHYLMKTERNSYVRIRLHAIAMAQAGKSAQQIATLLSYDTRTICRWVKKYNSLGREGLKDKPGRGRPPIFPDEETKQRFCQRLEQIPADGRSSLHGKDIQTILREEFGKLRSLSEVYYVLHSLGYEWLSPRPRHYRAKPTEQEAFKKKSTKNLRI